jgi:choice-of-anchor A domain-containing protein
MKKTLSVILAAIVAVPAVCLPVSAHANHVNDGDTLSFNGATATNAFGDLLDWNGVVFGDANNIIDLEGSLAVGGSFSSPRGLSVNGGAYGSQNLTTEDVAFLVNGNVNISGYGSVWGQTVVGNADGNTYHLSNVTPSATTNGQFAVADSSRYFADAKNTAYAVKAAVDALPVNGVCHAAYGTYTFVGDADAKTLVYNVDDANISSYIFDFTIAEGQTVVVNFTTSDTLRFKYGAVRINGKSDQQYLRQFNRNIILNVVSADKIEMTGCELYGTLLAPDAELIGNDANVCGTSILNGLTGNGGFELHVGYNNSFIPAVSASTSPAGDPADPTDPAEEQGEKVSIRVDAPLKMAVAFEDGTVCYGGEMKEFVYGKEYLFQMCSVNWENGVFDGGDNGIRGTVVYRMTVVHQNEFNELAKAAMEDPERYTVKGIDIIDNAEKKIIVNGDAKDTHLETDVNNFFMAYRFHFTGQDYNKKTGIDHVINTPLESLSVNLPLGTTVSCNAYIGNEKVDSADVFIEHNSGEGVYDDVFLTSVNDYTWAH